MGEREIRQFLLHLVNEGHASPATQRMFVASLKFLYMVTLKRPGEVARVPFPKVELGNDIEIIQRLLGHSSSRTTRRYARVGVEFLRRVKTPFDVVGAPQGEVLR
jgi:hypothetical protein